MNKSKEMTLDIGVVYQLVMTKGKQGFHGYYTYRGKGAATTFSAPGMTKRQIIKRFWERAKKLQDV